MGRGGRGGGGGRSSGGGSRGGSRSSGGRRGGRSSSRGGFSSSPSRSSFSSGSSFRTSSRYHNRHRSYSSGTYSAPRAIARVYSSLGLVLVMLIIGFALLSTVLTSMFGAANGSITRSTIEREPLAAEYVVTTEYYQDDIGWIGSGTKLESGMKSFFKETGVQPFLYLTEDINGDTYPSESTMDAFANDLYDQLFEDEGHLLLVFQEYNSDGQYYSYYVAGKQAKTVIDQEAADILLDYIDHYYYSDMSEEEFFSKAFEKAGERIMEVTPNPLVKIVIAVAVVAVIAMAFTWWKKSKKQKNLEAEQTERILNADLGDIAENPELASLENKYQN